MFATQQQAMYKRGANEHIVRDRYEQKQEVV